MLEKMNKQEFNQTLEQGVSALSIKLNQNQLDQFYTMMNLLLSWNEKINLTAITDPEEIIVKHFVDSLTISSYLKQGATVIDVGTGAGFPGIPLKIARPDLTITLLDSLGKRVKFLEEVIHNLKLIQIKAIHARAEDYAQQNREQYDVATSRAVAKLSVLTEYLLPFVTVGGIAVSMKGAEIKEELKEAEKAIHVLGGKIEEAKSFSLLATEMKRNIIVLKKVSSTPQKYPRKAGIPAKEPIE